MDSIISKYNSLLKDILGDFAMKWDPEKSNANFKKDVQKFYGFQNEFGWNILLNAFYVLDDTEFAKESFNNFSFQGPSRHQDTGERYLRLYGLLNALYQQKIAIENLLEIHKISNKKQIIDSLTNLEITKLRNKIAAHPSNYKPESESDYKFDVYEISRPDLMSDKITLLKNQNDFEYLDDFKSSIDEFDAIIINSLSLISVKVITKLFNNQGKKFELLSKLEKLKNGGFEFLGEIITFKK